jgi:FG-GAP repeat
MNFEFKNLKQILTFFFILFSYNSIAQEVNPLNSNMPMPDLPLREEFGYSITVEGDVAVVGSPGNDDVNVNAGKVFVYERSNGIWILVEELVIDSSNPQTRFGEVVLLNEGILFVGIPNFNNQEGRVAIYKKIEGKWVWINELVNDEPTFLVERFGSSIAVSNGVVAVGAPGQESAQEKTGAVFIFEDIEFNSHSFRKIIAPDSEISSRFGVSVAWNSTHLFVGDTKYAFNGSRTGGVFVCDRSSYEVITKLTTTQNDFNFGNLIKATDESVAVSSWGQNQNMSFGTVSVFERDGTDWSNANLVVKLAPANATEYGIYGFSLHLDNEVLIIGSRGGKVDFYTKQTSGWTTPILAARLPTGSSTDDQKLFGFSVSYDNDNVFIGAVNWNLPQQYSGATLVYEKSGDSWASLDEKKILTPTSSNAAQDSFGFSVDVDNNYAVVGAPNDDSKGESSGAAYILKFNGLGWDRIAKLLPSDGGEFAYFGWSVAISNNTVIIGAKEASPTRINDVFSTGKVYVFEKPSGEWVSTTESQQILRVDNLHEGGFGSAIDILGDEMVISHFNGGSSEEIGLVYIYERMTGSWVRKALLRPSANTFRQFGSKVKMDKNLIAVCAPISETFNGSVLLFEKPALGWSNSSQTAVLRPSDGASFKAFGNSVDIHGETILVGSTQNASLSGAAYIFEKNGTWKDATEDAILQSKQLIPGARFGAAVALGQNMAVVSSYQVNSESGLALVFRKTEGRWRNTSNHSNIGSFGLLDQFGFSLAIHQDNLLVGAPKATSEVGNESGIISSYLDSPSITKVDSPNPDGIYKIGQKIEIEVFFSQPIIVSTPPILKLTFDNNLTKEIEMSRISDNRNLVFEYTVQENEFSSDLSYLNQNSLLSSPDQIRSQITSVQALTLLPLPGSSNSLSGIRDLVIDGSIPVVVGIQESMDQDIIVYPNPFSDSFRIACDEPIHVKIMTITGVNVFSGTLQPENAVTPNVVPGTYIMKIWTKNGENKVIRLVRK